MAERPWEYKSLEELMDEEIRQYEWLIEVIKEEGKYLRQGSVENLLKSISKIEKQREILLALHEAIRKKLQLATKSFGPTKENLARPLPRPVYQKWQKHQQELANLKERARILNLQNKSFLQEVLGYWKEFRQIITTPGNNLSYAGPRDDNSQKTNPFFLDQQV